MGKTGKKTIIVHTVSEAVPFLATGGMGQVAGALTGAISTGCKDFDMRVIMPLYAQFRGKYEPCMEFLGEATVDLAWRKPYCGVFKLVQNGVTYYFVDNRDYFDRQDAYGYYDDGERFAFFSKAVFAVMKLADFVPDVIHAHDWQTALVPIYVKTREAYRFGGVRTVFTIHNMEYQGQFPNGAITDLFDIWEEELGLVEYNGCLNLMKGAIICADKLTTVSPSYAHEIQNGEGHGLEPIIRENAYKLRGIINGIDTKTYDPATDVLLKANYTADTLDKKAVNKKALQKLFMLPQLPRTPLLCVVSRLVTHKGIDIIMCMMERLMNLDVQILLLGTGDDYYELFFSEQEVKHPDKVGVNISYNPQIAGLIYAGADMMLMPSRSEPCGLTQMIACRYGTIPIVRKTGGLGDTIRDCRAGSGNGFVFEEYNSSALFDTVLQAVSLYAQNESDWLNLMREAMSCDFSWGLSAKEYAGIYKELRRT